jgi:hypothetical protein
VRRGAEAVWRRLMPAANEKQGGRGTGGSSSRYRGPTVESWWSGGGVVSGKAQETGGA